MNQKVSWIKYVCSILTLVLVTQIAIAQGGDGGNTGTGTGGDGGNTTNTGTGTDTGDNTNTSNTSTTTNATDNTTTNTDNTDTPENTEDSGEKEKSEDEDQKIKFDLRQKGLPEAKIWGQHLFRDQSITLFTRSRDIKAIDAYLLGAGDELQINVWGATAYSANVPIDPEGYIELSYPEKRVFIPRLYVKGMKFIDAKKAIVSRLSRHMDMKGSQYAIELNYARSLTVNITGEVFFPGSYTMPAVNTAFNALVASGGPTQIGSVRKIKVVSDTKEDRILDVYKFMNNPNVADEFFLENNDYIYVPLADRVVEIRGAVKRSHFYELIEGEDLIEVIRYAGRLQPDAYKRNIQIIRYTNDEEKLIDVNLTELIANKKDFKLVDGDIIQINPIKQAYSNYVTVNGAVKLPGTYELQKGSRVRDVLFKSGIIRSAVMERIYLKRLREDLSLEYININVYGIIDSVNSEDNIELHPFDILEVKYKSEFIDKYNVQIYGAVRKPGAYEYSKNLSLADVLYMSNGIQIEAAESYIEISRLHTSNDSNQTYISFQKIPIGKALQVPNADNILLEPYDQVFVRTSKAFELPKNVRLEGQILWPGVYTLARKDERVFDLMLRAGGYTDVAFLEGAKLFREEDGYVILNLKELEKEGPNSKYNYILREGDVIVVPRMKDLVSLAGRINHPSIRDKSEIDEATLELELEKQETNIERKEILLADKIKRKTNPHKINVPFSKNKRANYYLKEYAAGVDRQNGGRQRLVYVRYPDGSVKKTTSFLFFKTYPKVTSGSMVFVDTKRKKPKKYREKGDANIYKVITDTLAVVTSAALVFGVIWTASNRR